MKKQIIFFICIAILVACAPDTDLPAPTIPPTLYPTAAPTGTSMPTALWVNPAAPQPFRDAAINSGIPLTDDPQLATQKLDLSPDGVAWMYALVAPFPTVTDGVTFADLISTWKGAPAGPLAGRALLMDESTLRALTAVWGEPVVGAVRSVPSDQMLAIAWSDLSSWAIIPFEDIQPKWKVLRVDGQSPIQKSFNAETYQLKAKFGLSNPSLFALPVTNRDPAKLTTVMLTGVTAIVRATALTMELKTMTYPAELIRDTLREADITHVSNEVTFDKECPYPNSGYRNFILCSRPQYLDLLLDVGMDVVELTGDHLRDRGNQALLDTLDVYKANHIKYYGGGMNDVEARAPLLMEVNGNKIAFMGCNGKRAAKYPKASATSPGPADCDYDFFVQQVKDVKAQGYMVIFTFQHEECYATGPCYTHEKGFRAVADAGAVVVSGSQAHYPHIMEFRGDSFIHYGLGNLFFDQMYYILPDGKVIDETRNEFMDRYVFYDGKYLGVELLTSKLEDWSRPRPMTPAERAAFLADYFYYSGWTLQPTAPAPMPTVTLTPIAVP